MNLTSDTEIEEQAIRWFIWLRDNKADPEQVDVFLRWRESSALHRQAYDKVESLWSRCEGIDILDLPWPNQKELQLDNYDGSAPLALPKQQNPLRHGLDDTAPQTTVELVLGGEYTAEAQKNWLHWVGVAATVVLVTAAVGVAVLPKLDLFGVHEQVYVTPVAQQRVNRLDDGSVVTLGGGSEIIVEFDSKIRHVMLTHGEAFFEVAKDSQRPFIVSIGDSTVKAVGTAFNVNKRGDSITVSILEGVVSVTHDAISGTVESGDNSRDGGLREQKFVEGQQLVYEPIANRWSTTKGKLQRATLWREGKLAYQNERLGAILQDVNRYSKRALEIGHPDLAELRFTGTVFNDNIMEWLSALQESFPIKVLELEDRVVLLKS